jgi:hypothetical protein
MSRLMIVLVLLVAGVVGLGFYRGWFSVTSDSTDAKSNITLTMDQDKIQEDTKSATDSVQGLGQEAEDEVEAVGEKSMGEKSMDEKSMDGTLVSVSGDTLTMTNEDGTEHSHALVAGAEVTRDGKVGEVADLRPGMRLRVTTESAEPYAATRIEALDEMTDFE